jgi:aquaporin Z
MNQRVLAAEFLGTFALVLGGCGTAMFTGPAATGGIVAVSIAFGLTVLMMAYAVGHISGGHFNPAVTLGLVAGGRFPASQATGYLAAQIAGGVAAAAILAFIAGGAPIGQGAPKLNSMAAISNTFGAPGGYSAAAAFVTELVLTALFVIVIMGATSKKAPAGFAPIAIGLALTLIHLVSIPITNTSVNPARSLAPAIFAGGKPMADLWLFWLAPIIGGIIGGAISKWLQNE